MESNISHVASFCFDAVRNTMSPDNLVAFYLKTFEEDIRKNAEIMHK